MDQGGWTAVEYSAAIIVVAGAVYYYMKFIKKDWSFLIVLKIKVSPSLTSWTVSAAVLKILKALTDEPK